MQIWPHAQITLHETGPGVLFDVSHRLCGWCSQEWGSQTMQCGWGIQDDDNDNNTLSPGQCKIFMMRNQASKCCNNFVSRKAGTLTFAVASGKFNFQFSAVKASPVQVVHGIFRVTGVFKRQLVKGFTQLKKTIRQTREDNINITSFESNRTIGQTTKRAILYHRPTTKTRPQKLLQEKIRFQRAYTTILTILIAT